MDYEIAELVKRIYENIRRRIVGQINPLSYEILWEIADFLIFFNQTEISLKDIDVSEIGLNADLLEKSIAEALRTDNDITIPIEYIDKWLNKVERDVLCEALGYKTNAFLNLKRYLEQSGQYKVEFKKSYTNLYKITYKNT